MLAIFCSKHSKCTDTYGKIDEAALDGRERGSDHLAHDAGRNLLRRAVHGNDGAGEQPLYPVVFSLE